MFSHPYYGLDEGNLFVHIGLLLHGASLSDVIIIEVLSTDGLFTSEYRSGLINYKYQGEVMDRDIV